MIVKGNLLKHEKADSDAKNKHATAALKGKMNQELKLAPAQHLLKYL